MTRLSMALTGVLSEEELENQRILDNLNQELEEHITDKPMDYLKHEFYILQEDVQHLQGQLREVAVQHSREQLQGAVVQYLREQVQEAEDDNDGDGRHGGPVSDLHESPPPPPPDKDTAKDELVEELQNQLTIAEGDMNFSGSPEATSSRS